LHTPFEHVAVANGNEQVVLQPPQLAASFMKSKPSSTTPLQSLSRPSHASTPAFVFTHSQPFVGSLSASKKFWKQLNLQTPAWQTGSEFFTRHEWKQVPQFEMSVWRSGELLLHMTALPPVPVAPPLPPVPPLPAVPPAVPPRPPKPATSGVPRSIPPSVRGASITSASGGCSSTPKSQTRSRQPDAMPASKKIEERTLGARRQKRM
jgi:hypothetical protein